MKFSAYIAQQQAQHLTLSQKQEIFQRFETKKRHRMMLSSALRYTRVGALWSLLLVIIGVAYFGSFGGEDIGTRELKDGLVTFEIDGTKPVSYADEIGQIITTTGEVRILTREGEKNASDIVSLTSADKVFLLQGSELVFRVQNGVEAKISGPAEFELTKQDDTYTINMLAGEYVELKSIQIEQPKTDRTFVTNEPNPKPLKSEPVKVVVKTSDFEVSSDTAQGDIQMTISEKEGKQVVENTGADVVITKLIQDEKVVTQLKSQQTASINGDVEVIDMVQKESLDEDEALLLAQKIKNQELTISYEIQKESISQEGGSNAEVIATTGTIAAGTDVGGTGSAQEQEVVFLADADERFEKDEVVEAPVSVPVIPDVDPNTKRVIDDENLVAIQGATQSVILMNNVRSLVMSHGYGNARAKHASLQSLANTLSPISQQVLGGMMIDASSPRAMSASLSTMITNLESKWYIPPTYITRIKSVIAWLRILDTLPEGSVENTCDFHCVVNDVLEIPANQKRHLML